MALPCEQADVILGEQQVMTGGLQAQEGLKNLQAEEGYVLVLASSQAASCCPCQSWTVLDGLSAEHCGD